MANPASKPIPSNPVNRVKRLFLDIFISSTHASINSLSVPKHKSQEYNVVKDADTWTTGDEEMTGAQKSYLKTLSDQAGGEFDDSLTKADASKTIDELQQKTGRGAE